jgi:hypothetical protein
MPYKDPQERREYDRFRKRMLRAGVPHPSPVQLPREFRIRVLDDVNVLLEVAVELIMTDTEARSIERGRALVSIATASVRLIETRDLASRLEALEIALEDRRPK